MLVMASSRTDSTSLKRAAAAKALEYVSAGMKLGLGTGSTAEAFLDLLGPRVRGGLNFTGVATSERTAQKARSLGLPPAALGGFAPPGPTIDGAARAGPTPRPSKGGGRAPVP